MRADLLRLAARHRWIWSALGVLLLWLCLSALTQRVSLHAPSGVAVSASFLLIAALGQMIVVTTGQGNIDLSTPSVTPTRLDPSQLVSSEKIGSGIRWSHNPRAGFERPSSVR